MAGRRNQVLLLLVATMAAISVGICSAATYTVGDSTGWTIPSSSSFYPNWASKQTYQVGDVLVFNFAANLHTVGQVSKASYDGCDTSSLLSPAITTTPASVTLNSAGTHYFLCTMPSHCSLGQKLAVTVSATPSTPAATPRPSPRATPSTPAATPRPSPRATPSTPAATPRPSPRATPPTTSATPRPSPRSTATSPSPSPSAATTPAPSATTPSTASPPTTTTPAPSATTPSTASPPTTTTPSSDANAPSTPAESTPPPSGSFAAPSATGLGLLSLVSVAAAALLF